MFTYDYIIPKGCFINIITVNGDHKFVACVYS